MKPGQRSEPRRSPAARDRRIAATLHPLLRLQGQVGNAQIARMFAQRDDAVPMEDEEERKRQLQTKPDANSAQRQPTAPEEEDEEKKRLIQPRAEVGLEGGPLSSELAERIERQRGGGSELDDGVRNAMERTFGTALDDVRVHADDEADQLSRSIRAQAFTIGRDVFFRQGAYQPGSSDGRSLLGHELTHVVQQRQLSQTGPLTVGPAGDHFEQQADAVANAVTNDVTSDGATTSNGV